MDCSSPISIIICLNIPASDASPTGTVSPHWSMYCISAAVFRHTDLPPAFGPEMTSIRLPSCSVISSGTTSLPTSGRRLHNMGCRACCQRMTGFLTRVGAMLFSCSPTRAFARTKSTSATNCCTCIRSSNSGRSSLEKAISIRIRSRRSAPSSSRIWLFASTTCCGSIYTVLPEALSSCTMPPIFRL